MKTNFKMLKTINGNIMIINDAEVPVDKILNIEIRPIKSSRLGQAKVTIELLADEVYMDCCPDENNN